MASHRQRSRSNSPIPPPRVPRRDYGGGPPEDRRGPPGRDMHFARRRQRSMSPPDRGYGRRSPPHGPPKRYRRDERFDRSPMRRERYPPPFEERGYPPMMDDRYGGPPMEGYPPEEGYGYEYGPPDAMGFEVAAGQPPPPPPRALKQQPLSFKEFMVRSTDDIAPEEAQARYQAYLVGYHGSRLKAEFEAAKAEEGLRERFNPQCFEAFLERRNPSAVTEAASMVADIAAGRYDPTAPGFNQGALDMVTGDAAGGDGGDGDAARTPLLWKPSRVAADLALSRRLAAALDAEKGIAVNPLLPHPPPGEAPAGEGGDDATAAAARAAQAAALDAEATALVLEGEGAAEDAVADALGRLDVVLSWLWRVHGVDFYGGREVTALSEWDGRLLRARTLRGTPPEDGEEQEDAVAAADAEALRVNVDERWAARISGGDPVAKGCMREEVQRRLDEWIESQIVQHDENKWGSSVSNKLFMEKRFVVKHIQNKHEEKVAGVRQQIYEDLYWENYKAAHEDTSKAKGSGAATGNGASAPPPAEPAYGDGEGGGRGGRGGGGFRGRGRGPPGRGRGRGGMGGGMMLMDPGMGGMAPMMGAMDPAALMAAMGPIFIPAGPMGQPMLPMMGGGPLDIDPSALLPMMMPMGGGGGGRGMGGRGMGGGRGRGGGGGRGFGGRGGPAGGGREYYDLDAPRNNRMVLDYGDL